MTAVTTYLRTLRPELSRAGWTLQAGAALNAFGSGLVFPFVVIYLHDVRGLSLAAAGAAVAGFGAATFAVTPLAGAVADRLGARRTLAYALVLLAIGYGGLAGATSAPLALLCLAAAGLGNAGFWPSITSLMTAAEPAERRDAAFALQRMGNNLGMAAGGVVGGVLVGTGRTWAFELLFLCDALTFLAFAALLPLVAVRPAAARRTGGYRAVARDRRFVALIALNVVFASVAYGQFETILPAFATGAAGIGAHGVAAIFFLNMVLVAGAQLPVSKLVGGRRRLRTLAAAAVACSVAYALIAASGATGGAAALALLLVACAVFTLGELLHGPTQSAAVAALAPDDLRGRYFALVTMSYALGFTLGPALGGIVLAASPEGPWVGGAVVLPLVALGWLALDRPERAPSAAAQPA